MADATDLRPVHGEQWMIELDGEVLGLLDDPQCEDMFWRSYALHGDLSHDAPLGNDRLWADCRFDFLCMCCGALAPNAFCGGKPPFVRRGRILMRGLLVPAPVTRRRGICAWLRRLRSVEW